MRKLLYTTTALVGAAFLVQAAPAKAEVSLEARYNASIKFGEQNKKDDEGNVVIDDAGAVAKDPDARGSQFGDGARVDFKASKDHPNGLTTGFFSRMTMDGDSDTAAFDDVYGSVGGAFGTVTMGSVGDAGSNVHVGGTPGTTHFGVGEGNLGAGIGTDAVDGIIGRQQSLRYNSPSFTGFSFALSYAPETGGKRDGIDAEGDYNDAFALGLAYSNEFAGTSIKLSGSFGQTDSKPKDFSVKKKETVKATVTPVGGTSPGDDVQVVTTADEVEVDDYSVFTVFELTGAAANRAQFDSESDLNMPAANTLPKKLKDEGGNAFAFGAELGYQDFKFGGSWGQYEKGMKEVTSWRLGGSYSVDAFTFGVGYGAKESQSGAYVLKSAVDASGDFTGPATMSYSDTAGALVEETSLAFTVDYKLGDGANIDFGIEVDEVTNTSYKRVKEADTAKGIVSGRKKTTTYDDTMFGVGVTLSF